jgi:hypothetical protein
MTLKRNYFPWKIPIGKKNFSFEPLVTGIYFTTIFEHQFWRTEPDYYPSGYYGFSTKLRISIYLGRRFTLAMPSHKRFLPVLLARIMR